MRRTNKSYGPVKPPPPKEGSALAKFYEATGYNKRPNLIGAQELVSKIFVRPVAQSHNNPSSSRMSVKDYFVDWWALISDWRLFVPAAAMIVAVLTADYWLSSLAGWLDRTDSVVADTFLKWFLPLE